MVRRIKRVGAAVGLAAVAMLGGVGTAVADPPTTFTDTFTEVDEFLSELCGAEIIISATFTDRTVVLKDGSELHLSTFRATITGPGGSLIEREAWRALDTGDSFTVTGLPLSFRSPDGGVVLRDAGYVSFTDGVPTVVHGPHPFLEGEQEVICSYLV
jgi:hypothetical protein